MSAKGGEGKCSNYRAAPTPWRTWTLTIYKSQSPFLVSSSLVTAPPPSAQAQRRGHAPLPEPAWARSPGARSPRAPHLIGCYGLADYRKGMCSYSNQPRSSPSLSTTDSPGSEIPIGSVLRGRFPPRISYERFGLSFTVYAFLRQFALVIFEQASISSSTMYSHGRARGKGRGRGSYWRGRVAACCCLQYLSFWSGRVSFLGPFWGC